MPLFFLEKLLSLKVLSTSVGLGGITALVDRAIGKFGSQDQEQNKYYRESGKEREMSLA